MKTTSTFPRRLAPVLALALGALTIGACDADLKKLAGDGGGGKGGSGGSGGSGGGGGAKDGPADTAGEAPKDMGGGSDGRVSCPDPVKNVGCPGGQKCTLDCTMSTGFACLTAGSGMNEATCKFESDCAAGFTCLDSGGSSVCTKYCSVSGDCPPSYACTGGVRCSMDPMSSSRAKICKKV